MQTVRRLYIYIMLVISLSMTAFGLSILLEVGIDQLWLAFGGRDLLGLDSEEIRQLLSLALPSIAIAGPIWALHWRLANRAVRSSTPEDDERQSWVRASYFVVVVIVTALVSLMSMIILSRRVVETIFGTDSDFATDDLPGVLARLAVTGGIWAAHVWFQRQDARATTLSGAASWLPRFYVYAASAVGGAILLLGLTWGIQALAQWILGVAPTRPGEVWWHMPVSDTASAALPGLLIWGLHWGFISSIVRDEPQVNAIERPAKIRLVYLMGAMMAGVLLTIWWFANSFEEVGQVITNVDDAPGASEAIRLAIVAATISLPFIGVWIMHRNYLLADGRTSDMPGTSLARAVRMENYGAALAALFVLVIGASLLTGLLSDAALNGTRTAGTNEDIFRADIAWDSSLLIVGLAIWIYEWLRVRGRVASSRTEERLSLERRIYLYVVLGTAGVGLLGNVAFIVYRLLERLLGVGEQSGEFVSQLSYSVGFVAATAIVVAYHGVLLLRDLELEPVEADVEAVEYATAMLRLTTPVGMDVGEIVGDLRKHLPEDVTIEQANVVDRESKEPLQPVTAIKPLEAI